MEKDELKSLLFKSKEFNDSNRLAIQPCFNMIADEMRAMSIRERTIVGYERHLKKLCIVNGIIYIDELTKDCILKYLAYNNVSSQTKQTRLKAIRPILKKFHQRGWLKYRIWEGINIKVDRHIKQGATKKDLEILLAGLDFNDPIEYRDACIFLTIWETGVRLQTLSLLTVDMVDFDKRLLTMSGEIMKNHRPLSLPITQTLCYMLQRLIEENNELLRGLNKKSDLLFITRKGTPIHSNTSTNALHKRIQIYKEKFGLENINAHALRRGFAKKLLDNGISLPVISKALNHSSLEVTTQYLYIDNQEVIDELRNLEE